MVVNNSGYILTQYPRHNKIVIILPPTTDTIENTIQSSLISGRKMTLTGAEEAVVLSVVQRLFEGGNIC